MLEIRLLDVDLVVLDAAWGTLFGTWEVFDAGDGLVAAEVDDEEVREGSTLGGLPVG